MSEITVLTVTYNSAGLLAELVPALEALGRTSRIIVVDSASVDGTAREIRKALPTALVIEPGVNAGFGAACNAGLRLVGTPMTLLLNPDAGLGPESLAHLADVLRSDPGLAAVQPLVRLRDWPEVTAGRGIAVTRFYEGYDLGFMRFEPHPSTDLRSIPGAGAAVSLWRTDVLKSLSGFDEGIFMYFEDIDLCIRAALSGWRFALAPKAVGTHMVGVLSTRREAALWELESSLRIALKFSPGGRAATLAPFVAREVRTAAASARRGAPTLGRLRAVFRAFASRVPDCPPWVPPARPPDELPRERPGPSRELDARGSFTSGPGWLAGGRPGEMTGFGAMRCETGGNAVASLRSPGLPVTGRIWAGDRPSEPFIARSSTSETGFRAVPGRMYIASDDGCAGMILDGIASDG